MLSYILLTNIIARDAVGYVTNPVPNPEATTIRSNVDHIEPE